MKKKILWGLLCAILTLAMIACDDEPAPTFVAVTDITGVQGSGVIGVPLTLAGTVVPNTATHKAITWSVKSGSASITDGVLTATAAGNVVVTATIANGASNTTPFTKDFTISITAAGAASGINISFGDELFTLNRDITTPLSQADDDSITITLSRTFDSVRWIIDGEQKDALNNQTEITLNAADLLIGNHSATALVWDGVSWYSRTVTFTVGS